MAQRGLGRVIEQLRRDLLRHDGAGLTDGQLLEAYVARREDAAFAALVRRHGPMVWGVCRRILWRHQDAEDAFQATFLVLVRRASDIHRLDSLASWLYGVAHKTALKARARTARQQQRETSVPGLPEPPDREQRPNELRSQLDGELSRLPEKYRAVLVLCDLEGHTRQEAARRLSVPPGTVASRLATARALLAKRLARLGFAVSSAMVLMSESPAPVALLRSTIEAAHLMAAGKAAGVISAEVAALTEGVLRAMLLTKFKLVVAAALVMAMLGLGTSAAPLLVASVESADVNGGARDASATANAPPMKLGAALISQFKHKVPFEIGWKEFKDGGQLEILQVWGTQPTIKIGGSYVVHGRYRLPAQKRGKLYLFQTAASGTPGWDAWCRDPRGTPIIDLQKADADKGEGEFLLFHTMHGPGYFHVVLSDVNKYENMYGNVYFGTGDNVLRTHP
jgi:RNA polymerase sigma factor (sigma-70 family)